MPPTGAAASRRRRQQAAQKQRPRHRTRSSSNASRPDFSPAVGKGTFLVSRQPPPAPTRRRSGKVKKEECEAARKALNKQKSFRMKFAESMEQWKSVPALDVKEDTRDASKKSTLLYIPEVNPAKEKDKSKKKNQAGKKRFLFRASSSRTDNTSDGSLSDSAIGPPPPTPALSSSFPLSTRAQKFLIRRPAVKGDTITIENHKGKVVATIDETFPGRRLFKDKDGKIRAMILVNQEKYSPVHYSICGLSPVVQKQTLKFDEFGLGYYKWAHVRNAGGLNGQISLKHVKDEIRPIDHTFVTKMFGSVFRLKKTRGHVVLDEKKEECAKLVNLHETGRVVEIAAKQDVAMMLCYASIVDEMLENRMR